MKEHDMAVACLPPHTTHILQPLDDIPFAQLKTEWKEKLLHLNEATVGQKVNNTTIVSEFPAVFYNAINRATVKRGFLNMGIWPVDQEQTKIKKITTEIVNKNQTCKFGSLGYSSSSCWFPVFLWSWSYWLSPWLSFHEYNLNQCCSQRIGTRNDSQLRQRQRTTTRTPSRTRTGTGTGASSRNQ